MDYLLYASDIKSYFLIKKLQKKIVKFVVNFKKIGSWFLRILTLLGVTPKDKDLGLDKLI